MSVVIPTYNGARYLGSTIDSVLAQTYPRVEILVVDDGSTDHTAEVVQRYGSAVRYLGQTNAGTAAARNTGILAATGDLIALLDHDDLWLPDKLTRQVPRFADPNVGVVFAGIEFFDQETNHVTATYFPAESVDAHDVLAHMVLPTQTLTFRRSAFDTVGLFDATLPGTDDWDMEIRMAACYKVVGVPETLARVRLHETQQGRNAPRMYKNALRVVHKHRNLHPRCTACRNAARLSRRILRENYYSDHLKARVFMHLSAGHYVRAAISTVSAFLQNPPALKRVIQRCLS